MKANAPEKIYLDIEPNLDDCTWHLTNANGDSVEYIRKDIVKVLVESEGDNGYGKGCEYTREVIKEALLSEVLPCFMHGGEADEVVAKLEEVIGRKPKGL